MTEKDYLKLGFVPDATRTMHIDITPTVSILVFLFDLNNPMLYVHLDDSIDNYVSTPITTRQVKQLLKKETP